MQVLMQITMDQNGQVGIAVKGPLNYQALHVMLGEARRLLEQKLSEQEKGPQIQLAPGSLLQQLPQ